MVVDAACPQEYSLRPGAHFPLLKPGGIPLTECPFRQWPGCELQLVKVYFFIEDGRGRTSLASEQERPSIISETPE